MKEPVVLNEGFRMKMWDMLTSCEFNVQNLKGIVQNEMPISEDEFDEWRKVKNRLIDNIDEVTLQLYCHIIGI